MIFPKEKPVPAMPVHNFRNTNFELNKYEIRRKSLAESNEPIEGIFVILNHDIIIPDYYSEGLASESMTFNCYRKDNEPQREMYLDLFYRQYLIKKYPELRYWETVKNIPRGRTSFFINTSFLCLDHCYIKNRGIIEKLLKIYRLPENTIISSHYNCAKCTALSCSTQTISIK